MNDVMKWAFVGDLQIPYHDKRAVELFFKAMKWWKPDAIDIVGDIDDQLEYSSFSDGTTDEFFNQLKVREKEFFKEQSDHEKELVKLRKEGKQEEYDALFENRPVPPMTNPLPFIKENADGAREFYTQVRNQHPKADIHASLGNHEMRVFSYIDRKAPEVIKEITPEFLWGLDNLGITWRMYKEPPLERFAGIHVHHGDTTTSTGLAVKNDIENYGISLVRGHDHRGGVVYKSYPMTGRSLAGMGTGHLCDPNSYGMMYTINPAWEQGFGIAHVVDGKAHLQFIPIRGTADGLVCVLDGKVFKN
jgi:hypothetical protein